MSRLQVAGFVNTEGVLVSWEGTKRRPGRVFYVKTATGRFRSLPLSGRWTKRSGRQHNEVAPMHHCRVECDERAKVSFVQSVGGKKKSKKNRGDIEDTACFPHVALSGVFLFSDKSTLFLRS